MRDWRRHECNVIGVDGQCRRHRTLAEHNRVVGVHRPLRPRLGAGGEQHRGRVVRGNSRRHGRRRMRQDIGQWHADVLRTVTDANDRQIANISSADRRHHLGKIDAAEVTGDEECLAAAFGEREFEIGSAIGGRHRIDHSAQAQHAEVHRNRLPPVRQTGGDDIAAADAEPGQITRGRRRVSDEIAIADGGPRSITDGHLRRVRSRRALDQPRDRIAAPIAGGMILARAFTIGLGEMHQPPPDVGLAARLAGVGPSLELGASMSECAAKPMPDRPGRVGSSISTAAAPWASGILTHRRPCLPARCRLERSATPFFSRRR